MIGWLIVWEVSHRFLFCRSFTKSIFTHSLRFPFPMQTAEAKQKIRELTAELEKHNRAYYVENAPTISDREFDRLLTELIALEKQFPDYALPNSPTQRVG